MYKNKNYKAPQVVEDLWDRLSGRGYDGFHSTPDYTYTLVSR